MKKKIQQRVLNISLRAGSLLVVFLLVLFNYLSANPICGCCGSNEKKDNSKKTEGCCSSQKNGNDQQQCHNNNDQKSDENCLSCEDSCTGHIVCQDYNYNIKAVSTNHLTIQNNFTKCILSSNSIFDKYIKENGDHYRPFNLKSIPLYNSPKIIPLRI